MQGEEQDGEKGEWKVKGGPAGNRPCSIIFEKGGIWWIKKGHKWMEVDAQWWVWVEWIQQELASDGSGIE